MIERNHFLRARDRGPWRQIRIALIVVLGLVVGTAGFGYLWGIRLVRLRVLHALNALGDELGRPVTIDRLEVEPTALVVAGLVVSTPDGGRLAVEDAHVAIDPLAALRGDRRPRDIRLSRVSLQLPIPLAADSPVRRLLDRLSRGRDGAAAPSDSSHHGAAATLPPITLEDADVVLRAADASPVRGDDRGDDASDAPRILARLAVRRAEVRPLAGTTAGGAGLSLVAEGSVTDGPPSLPRTGWALRASIDRKTGTWDLDLAFDEPVPLPGALLPARLAGLRVAVGGLRADSTGAVEITDVSVTGALPGLPGAASATARALRLALPPDLARPDRWERLLRSDWAADVTVVDGALTLSAPSASLHVPQAVLRMAPGDTPGSLPRLARVEVTRPTARLPVAPPDLAAQVRRRLRPPPEEEPSADDARVATPPAAGTPASPSAPTDAPPDSGGADAPEETPADRIARYERRVEATLGRLGPAAVDVVGGTLVLEGEGRSLTVEGIDASLDAAEPGLARGFRLRGRLDPDGVPSVHFAIEGAAGADTGVRISSFQVEGAWLAWLFRDVHPVLRVAADAGGTVDLTFPGRLDDPVLLANGRFDVHGVGFDHAKIARIPVEGLGARGRFELVWDRPADRLDLRLPEVSPGHAISALSVQIDRLSGTRRVTVALDVPRQPCDGLMRDIPEALVPRLAGAQLEGTIQFRLATTIDGADADAFRLDLDGDWSDCHAVTLGRHIDVGRLLGDFEHRIWENGEPTDIVVGPGTSGYVPLDFVPVHVQQAALATEDMAFFRHEGFRPTLLTRAIRLNLRRGRYVYGGSTISQQLVKNLFLSREKTLSRKLEEAIITWHMERTVSKERILELYLNCIEFGPGIYGIRKASYTYFGVHPSALTPLEGAFIMGLKPDPKSGYNVYKKRQFRRWWREKMEHILHRLWKDMTVITEDQYRRAAPYVPVFHYPGEGYVRPDAPGLQASAWATDGGVAPGPPRSDDDHAPALDDAH